MVTSRKARPKQAELWRASRTGRTRLHVALPASSECRAALRAGLRLVELQGAALRAWQDYVTKGRLALVFGCGIVRRGQWLGLPDSYRRLAVLELHALARRKVLHPSTRVTRPRSSQVGTIGHTFQPVAPRPEPVDHKPEDRNRENTRQGPPSLPGHELIEWRSLRSERQARVTFQARPCRRRPRRRTAGSSRGGEYPTSARW